MERKVILVRHLKTGFNAEGKIMGGTIDMDVINDQESIAQMSEKVKSLLERLNIEANEVLIISSPLKRCLKTSDEVAKAVSPDIEILKDDDLRETDMGEFAGKKASELRQEYGDAMINDWMYNPENFQFPGGESYAQVKERVKKVMDSVKANYPDKKAIILCSHVDIIKMFICIAEGISFNERRGFDIPNASVSLATISDNGSLKVEGTNI